MRRATLGLLGLLSLTACHRGRGSAPPAAAASSGVGPQLTDVRPDTIRLGQGAVPTLTLTGRGFVIGDGGASKMATGGNTIHVGRATIERVAADAAGRTIVMALPLTYTDTASQGRPTAFRPGRYDVTVVTPQGTSNALPLIMIP